LHRGAAELSVIFGLTRGQSSVILDL
jgi:hypothetical protein